MSDVKTLPGPTFAWVVGTHGTEAAPVLFHSYIPKADSKRTLALHPLPEDQLRLALSELAQLYPPPPAPPGAGS